MDSAIKLKSVQEVEFALLNLSNCSNHPQLKSPCLPPESSYLDQDFGLQMWNPCVENVVQGVQPSVVAEFAQSNLKINFPSPFLLQAAQFGKERYKGLDENDRKYLEVLQKNLGNPLGIKNISSMTGIAMDTIENSIEPYLVRMGYVVRTSKGRILGKY